MLAVDGRLLATIHFDALHTAAYRLPTRVAPGEITLSLLHLHHLAPRGPGQMRGGLALGLMMHSLRIFLPGHAPAPLAALGDAPLSSAFESIGQGCQFGLVQRQLGVERMSLLRFVDTTTSMLYEALATAFSTIHEADQLQWLPYDADCPTHRWRQRAYGFSFDTKLPAAQAGARPPLATQAARLAFLRRKFLEDCAAAERIFVLTRSDCLTEPEALAVYCALTLHGPCTLLWATYGDVPRAGVVERVAPGFLRGELGEVEDVTRYARLDVWVRVMEGARKQAFLF